MQIATRRRAKVNNNVKDKVMLDRRLDAVGWALFLVMIGGVWLAPEGALPEGTWLIGTGVIILGMAFVRRMKGLAINGFWVFMGVVALGTGLSSVLGVDIPVFPILLVIVGLNVLVKPFLKEKAANEEDE